jgi:hypothetical protein
MGGLTGYLGSGWTCGSCATTAWALPITGASSSCATPKPRRCRAMPQHFQIITKSCRVSCAATLPESSDLVPFTCQKCIKYWLVLLQVVRQASGVVFLGGHPTRFMAYAVEELLTWYPFVPVEKTMQVRPRDLCFPPRKPKIVSFSTPQSVHTS